MPDYKVIVHNNGTRSAEVVWEHEYADAPLGALKQIVMRKDSVVLVPLGDTTVTLDGETLDHIRAVLEYVADTPLANHTPGITMFMRNEVTQHARDARAKLQEMGIVSG